MATGSQVLQDEKNINSLYPLLVEDVAMAFGFMKLDLQSQFFRRIFFRTIFSFIEGCVQLLKSVILIKHERENFLNKKTIEFITERRLDNNGKEKIIIYPVEENLKEVFKIAKKAWGIEKDLLDCSAKDYDIFLKAKEARNRLTHPRSPKDLEISEKDIANAEAAFVWINKAFYDFLLERVKKLSIYKPEEAAELEKMLIKFD